MKRVIFTKSIDVPKGDVVDRYKGGFVYNLSDEEADVFLADRRAYLEGEDPPFAEEDLEAMRRLEDLDDEARMEASARLARYLQDKAERQAEIEAYVENKRAARARGVQAAQDRSRGNS